MKKKIGIAVIMLIISTQTNADEPASVSQGAADYDWQSCLNAKANDCLNNCATSEDRDCQDNCNDLANDKCQSMGLTPPQGTSSP